MAEIEMMESSPEELLAAEEFLSATWASHLGRFVNHVSNFYKVGGTPDQAERMLAAVKEHFGRQISRDEFDRNPTLFHLLHMLGWRPRDPQVVTLRSSGARPPIFLMTGSGGVAVQFCGLARELGANQPFYVIEERTIERRRFVEISLRRQGLRTARLINGVAPSGPLVISGHSLGGLVALSAAHQLQRWGREVSLLLPLDSRPGSRLDPTEAPPSAVPDVKFTPMDLMKRLLAPLAGLLRFRGDRMFAILFITGNLRRRYIGHIEPWSGRSEVVITRFDPELIEFGWQRMLSGPRKFHHVEGSHTSFLRPPHLAATVQVVNGALERAWSGTAPAKE